MAERIALFYSFTGLPIWYYFSNARKRPFGKLVGNFNQLTENVNYLTYNLSYAAFFAFKDIYIYI